MKQTFSIPAPVCLKKNPMAAAPCFRGWEQTETMVASCLQGVMGAVFSMDADAPESALALIGDFCFCAGKPDARLLRQDFEKQFLIMVPQDEAWAALIEKEFSGRAERRIRYAMKKEPDCFNPDALQAIVRTLPKEYTLAPIDRPLYLQCGQNGWGQDLISQFPTYEDYRRSGLGFAVVRDGIMVSGASSYTCYQGGIEIEVDTRNDCRRRGLAQVCCAALILECLQRGLYPSWDAQNPFSVALAEKLGYHFSHTYPAYEVICPAELS